MELIPFRSTARDILSTMCGVRDGVHPSPGSRRPRGRPPSAHYTKSSMAQTSVPPRRVPATGIGRTLWRTSDFDTTLYG